LAPYLFWLQIVLAAAHGQLGEQTAGVCGRSRADDTDSELFS
jgi:hypothetical protein